MRPFLFLIVLTVLVLAPLLGISLMYDQRAARIEQENEVLKDRITALDQELGQIRHDKSMLQELARRESTLTRLEARERIPLLLLDQAAVRRPAGIVLERISRSGDVITLQGQASTPAVVQAYLLSLAEIAAIQHPIFRSIHDRRGEGRRGFDFSIDLHLTRDVGLLKGDTGTAAADAAPSASVPASTDSDKGISPGGLAGTLLVLLAALAATPRISRAGAWLRQGLSRHWRQMRHEFLDIDLCRPAVWTLWPRLLVILELAFVIGIFVVPLTLFDAEDRLGAAETTRNHLRDDFIQKLPQATLREPLARQLEEFSTAAVARLRTIPSQHAPDALLDWINVASTSAGLELHDLRLIDSADKQWLDFLITNPVQVRMSGQFEGIAAFIERLTREIPHAHLRDFEIAAMGTGRHPRLSFSATIDMLRYANDDEVAARRKAEHSGARK